MLKSVVYDFKSSREVGVISREEGAISANVLTIEHEMLGSAVSSADTKISIRKKQVIEKISARTSIRFTLVHCIFIISLKIFILSVNSW